MDPPVVVDRSSVSKLELRGEQALWFLDQLFTQSLEELPPQAGAESLLLTPKGRIKGHFRFLNLGDRILGWMDSGALGEVVEMLTGRIFATKVEIFDVSDRLGLTYVLGEGADQVTSKAGFPVPPPEEHAAEVSDDLVSIRLERPAEGIALVTEPASTEEVTGGLKDAGARLISAATYDELRVVSGWPHFGVDFGESHLPQEASMERAVHFDKGCYLGQEAVAMAQRGRIKRRLRLLEFDGSAKVGDATADEAQVGIVTSAAGKIGIGMMSTAVADGEVVTVEGTPATPRPLPGTREGPAVPSARELRERLSR